MEKNQEEEEERTGEERKEGVKERRGVTDLLYKLRRKIFCLQNLRVKFSAIFLLADIFHNRSLISVECCIFKPLNLYMLISYHCYLLDFVLFYCFQV
jgi:hypothetical protein